MTEEASRTGTYVPQSDDDWPATHPLLAEYKAPPHVEEAWKYWESIGKPKYLLAPMVNQSELPFRMLVRQHGVTGCYTPMFHAKTFGTSENYRNINFFTNKEDRPLIVQFNGNEPENLARAIPFVDGKCDAVDLNLGCPQGIASRGNYGAHLAAKVDLWPTIEECVKSMVKASGTKVWVKIRRFDSMNKTVEFARRLEAAGASVLCIHGRTLKMKGELTGVADWEYIKTVRQALSIPVLSNGNVRTLTEAQKCLDFTGCEGVVSGEGLLHNPALFETVDQPDQEQDSRGRLLQDYRKSVEMSYKYLDIVEDLKIETFMAQARMHIFRFFKTFLPHHTHLNQIIAQAKNFTELREAVKSIETTLGSGELRPAIVKLSAEERKKLKIENNANRKKRNRQVNEAKKEQKERRDQENKKKRRGNDDEASKVQKTV